MNKVNSKDEFFSLNTLLFLIVLTAHSFVSNTQETIVWAKYNFPPVYITEGQYQGEGMGDLQTQFLQEKMSEYQHQNLTATIPRIITEMEREKTICSTFLKTPEREKVMYFSIPSFLTPAHRIQILKSKRKYFEEKIGKPINSSFSLEYLLNEHPNLVLGVVENRSYGRSIDEIITKYKEQILFGRGSDNANDRLLNMFLNGRVDYVIEYPWISSYRLQEMGVNEEIHNIRIIESEDNLFGYTACSKTSTGEEVINKTNEILLAGRPLNRYRSFVERWLPSDTIERYRENYGELLKIVDSPVQWPTAGKLVVATDHWPPWKIQDINPIDGIDIRIFKEISRQLNLEIEFMPCTWKRCLKFMKLGKADITSSLLRRPDREEFMHYIEPAYRIASAKVFYTLMGVYVTIHKYEDLYKVNNVGVVSGTSYFEPFDSDPKISKVTVNKDIQLLKMLNSGRLSTFIGAEIVFDYLIYKHRLAGKVEKSKYKFSKDTRVYFAISKKSPYAKSLSRFNMVIDKMVKSGRIDKITDDFFKELNSTESRQ